MRRTLFIWAWIMCMLVAVIGIQLTHAWHELSTQPSLVTDVCGSDAITDPSAPSLPCIGEAGWAEESSVVYLLIAATFAIIVAGLVLYVVTHMFPKLWPEPWFRYGVMPIVLLVAGAGLDYLGYWFFTDRLALQLTMDTENWALIWNLLVRVVLYLPAGALLLWEIIDLVRMRKYRTVVMPAVASAALIFIAWEIVSLPIMF